MIRNENEWPSYADVEKFDLSEVVVQEVSARTGPALRS